MLERPRRIEKPWGYELIWAETNDYVGKILHLNAGEALSLQYHEIKDETLYLLSGQMLFQAGPSMDALIDYQMRAGEQVHVPTGTIHRMIAQTDVDILEVSTPYLDDVIRLDDRYGRIDHTNTKRVGSSCQEATKPTPLGRLNDKRRN